MDSKTIKCYCAGPDVFLNFDEYQEIKAKYKKLAQKMNKNYNINIELIFPIDDDAEKIECKNGFELANKIRIINENKIKECDITIANVEYFRGIDSDSGTSYEIGFARALGKSVFLYTNEDTLIKEYEKHTPFKEKYINVEDFGLPYNLMLFDIDNMHSKSFKKALKKVANHILNEQIY